MYKHWNWNNVIFSKVQFHYLKRKTSIFFFFFANKLPLQQYIVSILKFIQWRFDIATLCNRRVIEVMKWSLLIKTTRSFNNMLKFLLHYQSGRTVFLYVKYLTQKILLGQKKKKCTRIRQDSNGLTKDILKWLHFSLRSKETKCRLPKAREKEMKSVQMHIRC